MSNTEPTEAQIAAAARALNKRHATMCNVNEADSWAIQGDDFREDARAALIAALAQQPAASVEPVTLADVLDALNLFNRPKPSEDDGPWEGSHFIRVDHLPDFINVIAAAWFAPQPAPAPLTEDPWHKLYRRAINEANGLTNYVEDRPELRSAERRLTAIEAEARMLAAALTAQQGEQS